MAYAAVICVLNIVDELQDPDQLQTIPYPRSEVQDLREKLRILKQFVEKNSSPGGDLEVKIRDAMYYAENVFDSHLSKFVINSESCNWSEASYIWSFRLALEGVITEVDSLKVSIQSELPSTTSSIQLQIQDLSRSNLVVGRDADINHLYARLTSGSDALEIVPIFGSSGTGKTHLARYVYNDPDIRLKFKMHGWARVPHEYNKKEILLILLRSFELLGTGKGHDFTEDELAKRLSTSLRSGNYLVVLDDVCNREAWVNLEELFPNSFNRSRVILTTEQKEVAESANNTGEPLREILPLSEEESWNLLRKVAFGYESCPEELGETPRLVSAKCRGLPLAIVIIGRVLVEAGLNDWEIAASTLSQCGRRDSELIDAVMLLSYKSLPQYTKACLLYMGILPNDNEIRVSKLFKLWIAEGFLEKTKGQFDNLEEMAEKCLSQLVSRGIVLVSEQSPIGKMRSCRFDGVYQQFLKKKAEEEKFYHVVDEHISHFPDESWNQGRFCILKNVHFAKKEESKCSTKVRSLIFGGVQEQYPLWISLNFKLLRVLDALKIHFYTFPDEILELLHLRYLSLTYNREIPERICRLRNLQYLIVLRHLSSKASNVVKELPKEIWNLSELRHLQLMGRDLPDSSTTPHLKNLVSLLDVSSHTCTSNILRRVPNLKKLGVRIESPALDDAAQDFSFLTHLVTLEQLESFKFVVMHPALESQIVSSIPSFPTNLVKLSLSGCGLSWDDMNVISTLGKLESLKLRWHAFCGPTWRQGGYGDRDEYEDEQNIFASLKFLLFEDLDIERWEASSDHFPSLTNLVIRHCYRLREIPSGIGNIPMLKRIELVDCSSSAVKSAQNLNNEKWRKGSIQVDIHSSRDY